MDERMLIFLVLLHAAYASCETGSNSSIQSYDITWTFDQEYECGQFINGDYWVVGPVDIIEIDPAPVDNHWQDALTGYDCETPNDESVAGYYKIHGSMINPSPGDGQAYDSRASGYNDDLWIPPPTETSPLELSTGTSLISSRSFTAYCQEGFPDPYGRAMDNALRPSLKSASVLTVLDAAPSPDSFRPAYSGTDKAPYSTSGLRFHKLASLQTSASAPDIQEYSTRFQRVWIDHLGSWINEAIQPKDNMPQYGRNYARTISEGAILLNSDFTEDEKRNLTIYMIQLGIDRYGIVQNGGQELWTANGGISQGRKFPIMFAGVMLGEDEMVSAINMTVGSSGYISFQEDEQTFYVSQDSVDITNGDDWIPDTRADTQSYEESDIGLPEWGIRHAVQPERDNKDWGATYRHLNALAWPGFVLAVHAMDLREEWNHDALFDYQDRHMDVMSGEKYRADSDFQEEMWDLYRDDFGCTWKRIDLEDTYSQGYYDCGDSDVYCGEATCLNYLDDRACKYDPCNLECDCGCTTVSLISILDLVSDWVSGDTDMSQILLLFTQWKNGC